MALGFGCLLGLFVNFGFAILCALKGWSAWWLLVPAILAGLFAKPLTLTYSHLWSAWHRGHFLASVITVLVWPSIVSFAVQWAIYALARWLFV